MGQECTQQQKSNVNPQAATVIVSQSNWVSLIANMERNMADKWLIRPAWTWWTTTWLLFMAEASINPHKTKIFTPKINSFYSSNIWHLRNNKFVCFVFWTGFRSYKFCISKLVVWLICNLLFMRVCIVGYVTITVSCVLKYIDYW